MTAAEARILARLRRRLEAMELKHLREHALDLHQRLEDAETALRHEQDRADFWHEQAMTM